MRKRTQDTDAGRLTLDRTLDAERKRWTARWTLDAGQDAGRWAEEQAGSGKLDKDYHVRR